MWLLDIKKLILKKIIILLAKSQIFKLYYNDNFVSKVFIELTKKVLYEKL